MTAVAAKSSGQDAQIATSGVMSPTTGILGPIAALFLNGRYQLIEPETSMIILPFQLMEGHGQLLGGIPQKALQSWANYTLQPQFC